MLRPLNMVLDLITILSNLLLKNPLGMMEIIYLLTEFLHILNKHPKLILLIYNYIDIFPIWDTST